MRVGAHLLVLVSMTAVVLSSTARGAEISGERKLWHRITLTFEGPMTAEDGEPNPFTDYRLSVRFTNGDHEVRVAGYYAADGDAGQSGASAGNVWAVHFAPERTGEWSYSASFRTGENIAADTDPNAGESAGYCDGETGSFQVGSSDKAGRDFRAQGFLRHVGERQRRFSGSGNYFYKAGPGDPENFLGYDGFDNTPAARHGYDPHLSDWNTGDPTWRDGKGKEIIGMVNYLASTGVNTLYFLSWAGGDGEDAYPWTGPEDYLRYDCSKLAQWEMVFEHMTAKGIHMHLFLFEHEIDMIFGSGALNTERTIYFREMIARFGHNPGLTWNLGEEINRGANMVGGADPSTEQIKQWATFIRDLDPYDHPIAAHPYRIADLYEPLLGYATFDVAALQTGGGLESIHDETLEWVELSADAGHQWLVEIDEQGGAGTGIEPTDSRQNDYRKHVLWGNLMAGGAGVEYYFGYDGGGPTGTLDIEDMRLHDKAFVEAGYALEFVHAHVPLPLMSNADHLVSGSNWCLAEAGNVYLVYLPSGGSATVDLTDASGTFDLCWFDPRNGGDPVDAGSLNGSQAVSLGDPPGSATVDWAALLIRQGYNQTAIGAVAPRHSFRARHTGAGTVVYDMFGRRVHAGTHRLSPSAVATRHRLAPGVYILKNRDRVHTIARSAQSR